MRSQKEMLSEFDKWASANDLVRAAVLTSSRANLERETDFLSDYDIELFVSDIEPFRMDDEWLSSFGSIMVRWPYRPRSTIDDGWITRLVLFEDGVRIDFQITDQENIAADAYDDDFRVLIDKDNITHGLCAPTHTKHFVKRPMREEYDTLVHEFWWNATYIPKYLWRDELPFAASMLGQSVRDKYLRTIIEWYIGLQHNWLVNTGVCGRKFKNYLDGKTWSEYTSTFAGAGIEDNWQAFFNAVALFRKLAQILGDELGYYYPMQLDRKMTDYYLHIRSYKKGSGEPSFG